MGGKAQYPKILIVCLLFISIQGIIRNAVFPDYDLGNIGFIFAAFAGVLIFLYNNLRQGRHLCPVNMPPDIEYEEDLKTNLLFFTTFGTEGKGEPEKSALSGKYMANLIANISEALFVIDENKKIVMFNSAAKKLLKCRDEYLEGKPIDVLFKSNCCNFFLSDNFKPTVEKSYDADLITEAGEIVPVAFSCSIMEIDGKGGFHYICTARDMTETRKVQDALFKQANFDSLTQLYNRCYLESKASEILAERRITTNHHSLLMIDLDHFKIVNDTCGHEAGDQLLRHLSYIMKESLRNSDIIARVGGDEFAVFLPCTDVKQATIVAEKIKSAITQYNFTWEGKVFSVGASIGIAETDENINDIRLMHRAADIACFIAKGSGGSGVMVYNDDKEPSETTGDELNLFPLIMEALESDSFFLVYQPVANINYTGGPKLFEIYLRLRLKDGTVIPSSAFISQAYRYNMMSKIDQWVINTFFSSFHERIMPFVGPESALFSINISEATLSAEGSKEFIEFIERGLNRYNVPPEMICFEIKENAAISNFIEVSDFEAGLRTLGCKFALDDFGSSFSSFSYLKFLNADYVKIDGTLINDISDSPLGCTMVSSINEISHILNKKTIAKQVEGKDVFDGLKSIGIDYCQGYMIAEPDTIENIMNKMY